MLYGCKDTYTYLIVVNILGFSVIAIIVIIHGVISSAVRAISWEKDKEEEKGNEKNDEMMLVLKIKNKIDRVC